MYSGYGIAFDGASLCIFDSDFERKVVIFGVDNISSSHTDNRKNNLLVLGEGTTYDINGSVGTAGKKFSINFSETRTKFCLSLLFNGGNSYLFVTRIEIYKFKADNENVQLSNSVLSKKHI